MDWERAVQTYVGRGHSHTRRRIDLVRLTDVLAGDCAGAADYSVGDLLLSPWFEQQEAHARGIRGASLHGLQLP